MDDFAIRNESTDKYSLRGRVFHKIRDDILNGKYKEHEELKEVAIGNELGVSRTPVREALRQLELEGLVQIIPNRGAFVTGILGSPVKLSLEAILLGLGAGVGYALYSIFSRYALLRGYHNFTIVLYTFIFTAAAVIPLSDMGKLASVVTKSPGMAGFSALCGIVTTVFPYIVYNFGLTAVENGKAAIAASVEPVVATLIGVFIFRETMTAGNLAGIFMVLAAIVLANRREKQNHC